MDESDTRGLIRETNDTMAKELRGSPSYQVHQVFRVVTRVGDSKHLAKEDAREAGARTWGEMGARLDVYSYRTADAYRDVARACLEWVRSTEGVNRIERLESRHIEGYLLHRVEQGISLGTLRQEAAALLKLARALTVWSEQRGTGRTYDFRAAIQGARERAAEAGLHRFAGSRAYERPGELVRAVRGETMQLLARIQLESGIRCREVCTLRAEQLRGLGTDRITGQDRGLIDVHAKGGQTVCVSVSVPTYRALETALQAAGGRIRVSPRAYQAAVRDAARRTGQEPHGTHGLRWSWAQARMAEVRGHYVSDLAAMAHVSEEMGHHRADITAHYLR